ncbi:hypothetical protein ACLQ2D_10775 [Streptomyces sp. DT199]|uniref:hypothetical protein n=1 Tax=Streptomyces TaxID=1883 RepID=UPI0033B23B55
MGWNFWWGVAAFFLGGLATQLNGWLAYRRQRKDRADDAADALRQRREEFELQHLVEFNELLREAVAAVHAWEQADRRFRHLRDTNSLGDDAVERRLQANAASEAALNAAAAQVGYILVDDIRDAAHRLIDDLYFLSGGIFDGATLSLSQLHNQTMEVHDAIGARVRAIYAGKSG